MGSSSLSLILSLQQWFKSRPTDSEKAKWRSDPGGKPTQGYHQNNTKADQHHELLRLQVVIITHNNLLF